MLIATCWSGDPKLRFPARTVIMALENVLASTKSLKVAPRKSPDRNLTSCNLLKIDLWKTSEVQPGKIVIGDQLGLGANADVFKGSFQSKTVAVKLFRSCPEVSWRAKQETKRPRRKFAARSNSQNQMDA